MEENVPVGSICCFCNTSDVDEALYGKLYKYKDLITHYFCLLLASKVLQRGSDEEGILGFLPNDIIKEVQRGKSLTCIFCRKRGATIACYSSKCKVHFHLPCGRKKDTFHQFFGEFKSYCPKHRLKQKINPKVLKAMSGKKSVNCVICLEPVSATPAPNTLWAPCCSKEAWFHRLCLQRLALSAGYFFKCPLCNNTKQFVEAMRTYGIWIPEQDASWEAEPERYSSLLERHNSCDAKSCRCRRGRTFHMDNTKWEIKLCVDCGSQGMHVQCGNLRVSDDWACPICSSVTVHKENLSRANKRTGVTQSVQNISRRATRRVQHIIRRVTTRQSQPSQEDVAEEDNEDEDVNVEDYVDEPQKDNDSEEPQQSSQVNNIENSQSRSPAPNISFSRKKILEPHSRPRDKKRRLRSGPKESSDEIEVSSDALLTQEKSNDLEIIDVEDNSDDEVQILFTPNIKFIKTNEGVSLPVVKVPASSAPSGDGVVASGEPCQPSFNTVQTVDLEDGVCDVVMDECQPSTSHKYDLANQSLGSVTEVLVSGELFPSDDDDELQILEVTSSKNHQPSMKGNSVDAWIQPHALSTEISDEAADISILKTRLESKSFLTENIVKLANTKPDSDAVVCLPLTTPNITDGLVANLYKPPPALEESTDSLSSSNRNYEKLKVGQTIIHSLPPLIDRMQTHNIEVSTSSSSSNAPSYRNANGLTSNAWIGGPEHCVSLSGPGMIATYTESQPSALVSNSNVTMVHSTFSLPPSMLPPGTRAVLSSSIPIIHNSQVSLPEARNHFIAPSLPSLNPLFVSQSTPTQVTASSDVSFSTNGEHESDSLASVAPQALNSISSSSVLLDTPLTEGQAYCQLPSQVGQDDWSFSLKVVSANGIHGPKSLQMPSCPGEDRPEVIVERNPGPVPLVPSLWSETKCESGSAFQGGAFNGNSSTNCNPMQQMAGARERKQKLIERPDFNQHDQSWAGNSLCHRKREPPSCTCQGDNSFECYFPDSNKRTFSQQYVSDDKSYTSSSESNLIAKFFSELANGRHSKVHLKEVYCTNLIFPNAHVVQACPATCLVKTSRSRSSGSVHIMVDKDANPCCSRKLRDRHRSDTRQERQKSTAIVLEMPHITARPKRKRSASESLSCSGSNGKNLKSKRITVMSESISISKKLQQKSSHQIIKSSDVCLDFRNKKNVAKCEDTVQSCKENKVMPLSRKLDYYARHPSFQPVIVLNRISVEDKFKKSESRYCRSRSESMERTASVCTQKRKSRREQFLDARRQVADLNNLSHDDQKSSFNVTHHRERKYCRHFSRSPVRTRSRSRSEQRVLENKIDVIDNSEKYVQTNNHTGSPEVPVEIPNTKINFSENIKLDSLVVDCSDVNIDDTPRFQNLPAVLSPSQASTSDETDFEVEVEVSEEEIDETIQNLLSLTSLKISCPSLSSSNAFKMSDVSSSTNSSKISKNSVNELHPVSSVMESIEKEPSLFSSEYSTSFQCPKETSPSSQTAATPTSFYSCDQLEVSSIAHSLPIKSPLIHTSFPLHNQLSTSSNSCEPDSSTPLKSFFSESHFLSSTPNSVANINVISPASSPVLPLVKFSSSSPNADLCSRNTQNEQISEVEFSFPDPFDITSVPVSTVSIQSNDCDVITKSVTCVDDVAKCQFSSHNILSTPVNNSGVVVSNFKQSSGIGKRVKTVGAPQLSSAPFSLSTNDGDSGVSYSLRSSDPTSRRAKSRSPPSSCVSSLSPSFRRARSRNQSPVTYISRTLLQRRKSFSEIPDVSRRKSPSPPLRNETRSRSRSVSAIEKECRIKALALTARKFVPVSRVASEQREMLMRLQQLHNM